MLVGPPGSGHETLGLALMRLPDVLPMTLVQEQSFVHLWWANGGRATEADTPADPAVLASAAETLRDWARQASASGSYHTQTPPLAPRALCPWWLRGTETA